MKKSLLLAGVIMLGSAAVAQRSVDIDPYSSLNDHLNYDRNLEQIHFDPLNMAKVMAEDSDGKDGTSYKICRFHDVDKSLENGGTWVDVPGGKLWRLSMTCEGALATYITYDDFYIPDGAYMHVYNGDKSDIIGAFTNANYSGHKEFATGIVAGETAIIEYYEPNYVSGKGKISVDQIAHCYRGVDDFVEKKERGSDPCQVDVRCSEGDNWGPQIDATVRLLIGGGWCSGSVMNNTNVDCKPYVLTALHCGEISASQLNSAIFYFRRQRANCGSGALEGTQSITGASRLSDSNDGGGNSGSDYLLVELNSDIPWSYQAYYAGWNKSTTAASSGVSTHHPSGDVKKISTFSNNLLNAGWGIPGTHWRVTWTGTANGHGVTEGGSSGSPIWDQNGYHVGQLTGGSSYCTATSSPDLYGKMSYNWSGNSNPTGGDLSNWLDPTGAMTGDTFDGTYAPCANNIEEATLELKTNIYPNPSSGLFTIEMRDVLDNLTVEIYNSVGALVETFDMSNRYVHSIDLTGMEDGMYYARFKSRTASVTKSIQLIR